MFDVERRTVAGRPALTVRGELDLSTAPKLASAAEPMKAKTPQNVMTYVNFMAGDEQNHVRAAYGVNYEWLLALKNRYDPTNFFHFEQSL